MSAWLWDRILCRWTDSIKVCALLGNFGYFLKFLIMFVNFPHAMITASESDMFSYAVFLLFACFGYLCNVFLFHTRF